MPSEQQPVRTRIAGLECLEVRLPGQSEAALTVVLLHGYGADMADLAPLAQALPLPAGSRVVFPNGPVSVPMGPFWTGSAWFPIDLVALERAMATGSHRDLSGVAPPELHAAREAVLGLLAALQIPLSRLVLGGFSQGAMLAVEVALHLPQPPAGILIWSGTLLQADVWAGLAPRLAGMPFVQSHGRSDPLLAFDAALRLHELLVGAGCAGEFVAFGGGHEIPPPALQASGALLRRLGADREETP